MTSKPFSGSQRTRATRKKSRIPSDCAIEYVRRDVGLDSDPEVLLYRRLGDALDAGGPPEASSALR